MSFNSYDESAHDILKKAHHQMQAQLKKSWFYWPLAWMTSLGSELTDPELAWQDYDKSAPIFAKRYFESYSFIQWIFVSFLDKETKGNFEKAMEIYAALSEPNHKTPKDFDLHNYPIDILNIEINRTLIRQMTDIDLRIYHTLHLKPKNVEQLLKIKEKEPNKYSLLESLNDAKIENHISDVDQKLLDADESCLSTLLSQLNNNCPNCSTYQDITRNLLPAMNMNATQVDEATNDTANSKRVIKPASYFKKRPPTPPSSGPQKWDI